MKLKWLFVSGEARLCERVYIRINVCVNDFCLQAWQKEKGKEWKRGWRWKRRRYAFCNFGAFGLTMITRGLIPLLSVHNPIWHFSSLLLIPPVKDSQPPKCLQYRYVVCTYSPQYHWSKTWRIRFLFTNSSRYRLDRVHVLAVLLNMTKWKKMKW